MKHSPQSLLKSPEFIASVLEGLHGPLIPYFFEARSVSISKGGVGEKTDLGFIAELLKQSI